MKYIYSVIIACFLIGCAKQPQFTISYDQVLSGQSTLRGQIFQSQGTHAGPFQEGAGFVGNINSQGSFRAADQSVSYPATPNYFYEGYSFINSEGKSLIIIRKVHKNEVPERAEQGAGANG